jgi:cytochrome c553
MPSRSLPIRRRAAALLLRMLLAIGLVAAGSGARAEPQATALVESCASCHGPGGASTTPGTPSLAGQNAHYLLEELEEFANRTRPTSVREHRSEGLATTDLTLIANHFATQAYVRQLQDIDSAKIARGAEAYEKVCQLCHPDNGRATTYSEYPLLAGQDLAYMRQTMAEIVSGKRPANGFMREMIALATPERLDDAIHFFAAQEVFPEEVKSMTIGAPNAKRRRFNPSRQ